MPDQPERPDEPDPGGPVAELRDAAQRLERRQLRWGVVAVAADAVAVVVWLTVGATLLYAVTQDVMVASDRRLSFLLVGLAALLVCGRRIRTRETDDGGRVVETVTVPADWRIRAMLQVTVGPPALLALASAVDKILGTTPAVAWTLAGVFAALLLAPWALDAAVRSLTGPHATMRWRRHRGGWTAGVDYGPDADGRGSEAGA